MVSKNDKRYILLKIKFADTIFMNFPVYDENGKNRTPGN